MTKIFFFDPEDPELHQNPRKSKLSLLRTILQCEVHPKRYKPFSVADTIATKAFCSEGHQHVLVLGEKAAIPQLCLQTGVHVHHDTLALHHLTKRSGPGL